MAVKPPTFTQETIVLNDYNGSTISRRTRTSLKTGKVGAPRLSFEIKSEPIVHVFDDEALGLGPALALKEIIGDQIRAIKDRAADRTLENRKYSQNAFRLNAMNPTDTKRYAGGQIGELEPNQTVNLFNDSGRLGGNLAVGKNRTAAGERDWVVNVPGNRFRGHTEHLAKQLFALVPALGNPRSLQGEPKLRAAVDASIDLIIAKAKDSSDARYKALLLKRKNYRIAAGRALVTLARSLTGV